MSKKSEYTSKKNRGFPIQHNILLYSCVLYISYLSYDSHVCIKYYNFHMPARMTTFKVTKANAKTTI